MQVWYLEIKSKNFCIVLSSPSGAGKTSISKKLLQKDNKISLSVSCTTRPKRRGEINKKDYIEDAAMVVISSEINLDNDEYIVKI